MQYVIKPVRAKLALALGLSTLSCAVLYLAYAINNGDYSFWYLSWNLFLAWVALLISLWLEKILQKTYWSSWYGLFVTFLWLVFLPNTFYMISDFIHIKEVSQIDLLYNVVMFSAFVINGAVLGFLSLFIIHKELIKRISALAAGGIIGMVLFVCSFGIYIGRELRWNTWDLLTNPFSLLFDVSDRLITLQEHPQVITITLSFFVLLGSIYLVTWFAAEAVRASRD